MPPADLEARLERGLKTAGLVAGPALALVVFLWNPGGHPPEARRLLAILALAIAWWITEAIPLPATALVASALAIAAGVAPARQVLAPYADPVIFLFLGSFLLAEAVSRYGLDVRIASWLLGLPVFARTAPGPHGRVRHGLGRDLDRALEHRHRRPHDADRARRPRREGRGPAPARRLGRPPDDRLRRLDRRDGDAHRHAAEPAGGRLPGAAGRRARHASRAGSSSAFPIAFALLLVSLGLTRLTLGRGLAEARCPTLDAAARRRERDDDDASERRAGARWTVARLLARLRALARALARPGRPRPRAPARRGPREALPRGRGGAPVRDPAVRRPDQLAEAPLRPELGRRPARQLGRAHALRRRALARHPRRGDRHREVGGRGRRELRARHEPGELHARWRDRGGHGERVRLEHRLGDAARADRDRRRAAGRLRPRAARPRRRPRRDLRLRLPRLDAARTRSSSAPAACRSRA